MASHAEFTKNRPVFSADNFRRLASVEPIVAAALYAAIASAVTRWWEVYQFSPDEGINLMKAALAAAGYDLYSEIWSDQPPVFTMLLVPLQWMFPASVNAARALVLGFAALMVFSLFRIVSRADGRAAAWLAVAALAGERMFVQTSISVLIGMPAIALALAGLDQALAGAKSGSRLRFLTAGILIGLALQTKLFVVLMLPAVALVPFVGGWSPGRRLRATADLGILGAAIAVTFSVILLVLGEPIFEQLLSPHAVAAASAGYAGMGGFSAVLQSLTPQWLLALALIGALASIRPPRLGHAIPLVWLTVAGTVLLLHRPYWTHQAVLLQVPIAWLCGQAVVLFDATPVRRWAAAAMAAAVLWLGGSSLYNIGVGAWDDRDTSLESPLLSRDLGVGRWVVADYPMDAYRANSLVPPELAVYTEKRLVTGNLTIDEIVTVVKEYLPEEILLRRFRPDKSFVDAIRQDYGPAPVSSSSDFHAVRQYRAADTVRTKKASIVATLTIATADLASRAAEGGYPGHIDLRSNARYGRTLSDEPLLQDEIGVRPPGSTQEVGQCMRRLGQITGDALFQGIAISAGRALACAQRYGGGWNEEAELHKPCGRTHDAHGADRTDRPMSFDDGTTATAVEFLLDLLNDIRASGKETPAWLRSAVETGIASVLRAQGEAGGWPQRSPETDYRRNYTFNDSAIPSVIGLLLRAQVDLGEKQHLDAALRGGEFILATQGPADQAGWAQQYDADLKPVSARTFEPAAYSSRETGDVMNTLLDLYAATADEKYADSAARARRWLEASTIRPGEWARFYEIGTNRPIYGDRDGSIHYDLNEISEERRKGYDWEGRFSSVVRAFERDDARRQGSIEALKQFDEQARRPVPLSDDEWTRVGALVEQVAKDGRWAEGDVVSTATFVENCNLLARAIVEAE